MARIVPVTPDKFQRQESQKESETEGEALQKFGKSQNKVLNDRMRDRETETERERDRDIASCGKFLYETRTNCSHYI